MSKFKLTIDICDLDHLISFLKTIRNFHSASIVTAKAEIKDPGEKKKYLVNATTGEGKRKYAGADGDEEFKFQTFELEIEEKIVENKKE